MNFQSSPTIHPMEEGNKSQSGSDPVELIARLRVRADLLRVLLRVCVSSLSISVCLPLSAVRVSRAVDRAVIVSKFK
jgi:hypothetical protein